MLIIGPQSLYLFFHLHHVLIKQLNIARRLAYSVNDDTALNTLLEHMSSEGSGDVGSRRYDAFISLVYCLVEGNFSSSSHNSSTNVVEGGKYEDRVRSLLGHGAYELATMDKLVSHILKNLQNMANLNTMQNMIQVFHRHKKIGSFKPIAFRQEASMLSEGENMFAMQYCKVPKSDETIMHMEFLGCIAGSDEEREFESAQQKRILM
jgi:histone deacetylase complex regulatory component SIN3